MTSSTERTVLRRPVVIVSAPRSGSTLLYETLARARGLWSIGGESHHILESLPRLRPAARGDRSHRLTAADADPDVIAHLHLGFLAELRDRDGRSYLGLPRHRRPRVVRLLEKTPRNSIRVSFLEALFPDALYLFLHRDARACISSIMEAWRSPGFWQFRGDLPGWDREEWCMLLPPGWRSLVGRTLEEIAAFQWRASNELALLDLEAVPPSRWMPLRFEAFLREPRETVAAIFEFADLEPDPELLEALSVPLRPSGSVVTHPDPDKWRANEGAIARVWGSVEGVQARLSALGERRPCRPSAPGS